MNEQSIKTRILSMLNSGMSFRRIAQAIGLRSAQAAQGMATRMGIYPKEGGFVTRMLKDEQKDRIMELSTQGMSAEEIADDIGCSIQTVRRYMK